MKFHRKRLVLKYLYLTLITLLISITIYLISIRNSASKIDFEQFISLYVSKNIEAANKYILNNSLPNIGEIFSIALKNSNDELQTEIINIFEELFYSIDYKIISSKTLFNKSTINIQFSYYDLAKHTINYFKNYNDVENNNYDNFIKSLETTKYKISTNIDVELIKKNNQWNIVLSEKLINILTSGLYKNFVI